MQVRIAGRGEQAGFCEMRLQTMIISSVARRHNGALHGCEYPRKRFGLLCKLPGQCISNIIGHTWNMPEL
eukprot:8977648-Alexandrium_andersonii.AAC.1